MRKNWRKSTASNPNGACIEAASWRKSTFSGGCSAMHECVEAGHGRGVIGVRDSKLRQGPELEFSVAAWEAFTRSLRG